MKVDSNINVSSRGSKIRYLINFSDTEINKLINIQGTEYDRHMRFSPHQINMMKNLESQGVPLSFIAKLFNTSYNLVRYHTRADKVSYNKKRNDYPRRWVRDLSYYHDLAEYKRDIIVDQMKSL